MEKTAKNKWLVRGAAVLIFLLGFVAGALALNVYRHYGHRSPAAEDQQARFEQMMDQLKLNDGQKAQTRQIVSDTRAKLQALRQESAPKVADIRKQADDQLQKIMSADQWAQFQKMRDDERTRGRGRGRPDR